MPEAAGPSTATTRRPRPLMHDRLDAGAQPVHQRSKAGEAGVDGLGTVYDHRRPRGSPGPESSSRCDGRGAPQCARLQERTGTAVNHQVLGPDLDGAAGPRTVGDRAQPIAFLHLGSARPRIRVLPVAYAAATARMGYSSIMRGRARAARRCRQRRPRSSRSAPIGSPPAPGVARSGSARPSPPGNRAGPCAAD